MMNKFLCMILASFVLLQDVRGTNMPDTTQNDKIKDKYEEIKTKLEKLMNTC